MTRCMAALIVLALLLPLAAAAQSGGQTDGQAVQDYRLDQMEKRLDRLDERLDDLPEKWDQRVEQRLEKQADEVEKQKEDIRTWMQGAQNSIAISQNIIMIFIGVAGIITPIILGIGVFLTRQKLKEIEKNKQEIQQLANSCRKLHDEAQGDALKIKDIMQRTMADLKFSSEDKQQIEKTINDDDTPLKVRLQALALKAEAEERWRDAIDIWHKVLAMEPNNEDTLFRLGYCNGHAAEKYPTLALGHLSESAKLFQKVTEISPGHAKAFYNWGKALNELGRRGDGRENYVEACEKYKLATEINPRLASAFFNWGVTLTNMAETDPNRINLAEACEKYQRAIEINPNHAKAFSSWGVALMERGKQSDNPTQRQEYWHEAKAHLLRAEQLEPGRGTYNLACLAALQGDPDNCRHYLEACLSKGTMPDCDHLRTDSDLESMRGEPWFQEIERKVCEGKQSPAEPEETQAS